MNDVSLVPEEQIAAGKHCPGCDNPIITDSRFCKHCGAALQQDDTDGADKWGDIRQVAILFVIETIICALIGHVEYFKTFGWSITGDIILATLSIGFFCSSWAKNKAILLWHNFSVLKLAAYCGLAVVASFVINNIISWINRSLYSRDFSYYRFYSHHQYGVELTVLFVAVMPALFEELAYRGFIVGKLLNVVDKKQAIFISSFMFAIMHMSFMSLFWLIPFAFWLGYLRVKEKTLWYGVLVHFTFNLTAVMMDILTHNHR